MIAAFHATKFTDDEETDKEDGDDPEIEIFTNEIFENVPEMCHEKYEITQKISSKSEDKSEQQFLPTISETKTEVISDKTDGENISNKDPTKQIQTEPIMIKISDVSTEENSIVDIISNKPAKTITPEASVSLKMFDEKDQLTKKDNGQLGLIKKIEI